MAMGNGGHTRGAGGGHGQRAGRGHAESKSHTNQQSVSASVQQQKGCRQQHRTLAWGEATVASGHQSVGAETGRVQSGYAWVVGGNNM